MKHAAMETVKAEHVQPPPFYLDALEALNRASAPYLVGGGFALFHYTGIDRRTNDFDIFVRPGDMDRVLELLSAAGYLTEVTFSHWLGKARRGADYVDVIFSSGNGVARVDDGWFVHASSGAIRDLPVLFCPPEETIWSKAFVMERERFDGADVTHLILACGPRLDWDRLLARFGAHWRVLYAHLVMFGYVYPDRRDVIPGWVMKRLGATITVESQETPGTPRTGGTPVVGGDPSDRSPPSVHGLCRGTLLSRAQYLVDVENWGRLDARLAPEGPMTADEIALWTAPVKNPTGEGH